MKKTILLNSLIIAIVVFVLKMLGEIIIRKYQIAQPMSDYLRNGIDIIILVVVVFIFIKNKN